MAVADIQGDRSGWSSRLRNTGASTAAQSENRIERLRRKRVGQGEG